MIYKCTLCFKRISFGANVQSHTVDPVKGVWLQRNHPGNPLALLAVNRQVYLEARRVFYHCNTFHFRSQECLSIFLIGIGRENASHLQSVEWEHENGLCENYIDIIKSHALPQTSQSKQVDIWNDEDQFKRFELRIDRRWLQERLLRLDAEDASTQDMRYHYVLTVKYQEDSGTKRTGKAGYELLSQRFRSEARLADGTSVSRTEEHFCKLGSPGRGFRNMKG
ncbi:hypothetical protein BDV25DRAFT_159920 [Aspergillus avenaceus]|uniref:Uncharacterized protein n=1 Tax=Aspergillus avenaceus TaxID=36643 RepID=A0A5N6TMQ3_ASPAV|nr:hypothetical protein BDV25DRAFT_159920 [Aspergillus avenaceus]